MKVAIVHYWLVGMRGGEKVIEAICELFPEADIYTHVVNTKAISETLRKHRVRTTFIARLPFSTRLYKSYLPMMPAALERLDLTDYDLVISSESGPAKGVVTRPDAIHICYCHSPMRYIWDKYFEYRAGTGFFSRLIMSLLAPSIRNWDYLTASRVDHFVSNSNFVGRRVRKFYRRESTTIYPPVDVAKFSISSEIDDYYVTFGQLVGYKRFDIAVEAFTKMNKKLIVIGTGEELKKLRARAGKSVTFAGRLSDAELAEKLRRCKALIFPGEEDFGIVPLEAMASGRPVIAYGSGGAIETVVDGVTGVLVPTQGVDAFIDAVHSFEGRMHSFDPAAIRAHAVKFDRSVFKARFKAFIAEKMMEGRLDVREPRISAPSAALHELIKESAS